MPTQEVVCMVDDEFLHRAKIKKKEKELKKKMEHRLGELKEMAAYEMMAKAELLKQYKEIEVIK